MKTMVSQLIAFSHDYWFPICSESVRSLRIGHNFSH